MWWMTSTVSVCACVLCGCAASKKKKKKAGTKPNFLPTGGIVECLSDPVWTGGLHKSPSTGPQTACVFACVWKWMSWFVYPSAPPEACTWWPVSVCVCVRDSLCRNLPAYFSIQLIVFVSRFCASSRARSPHRCSSPVAGEDRLVLGSLHSQTCVMNFWCSVRSFVNIQCDPSQGDSPGLLCTEREGRDVFKLHCHEDLNTQKRKN